MLKPRSNIRLRQRSTTKYLLSDKAMIVASVIVLAVALGVLVPSASATSVPDGGGTVELCEWLHVFTVNTSPGGITVKYKNSQSSTVSTTVLEGHSLPPPRICGNSYKRCSLHITSNFDKSIRVAIFPLRSGIGLVSYDYLSNEDTLVYRDQFVLTQIFPNCSFMYFTGTREVVGYCLDLSAEPAYMYSLRIGIQYDNLSLSVLKQHNVGERVKLINFTSLSNFVYFDFNPNHVDHCFSNEAGHVVCLENGEVLDHGFSDERFVFKELHISACSSVSRLLRVGMTCKLVAYCDDNVFLFEVHQDQPTVLSNRSSGQVFVCTDLQTVKLANGNLSLHTDIGTWTGMSIPFPLERIRQGDCFIIDGHYLFFATLVDGRTLLSNFTSASYRQLGASEHATYVPSMVKGQIGLVHDENETLVYNLSLPCHEEPTVIPDSFILANYFSTGAREQCWCPSDSSPSMPTSIPVSQPTTVIYPTSVNDSRLEKWEVLLAVILPVTVVVVVPLLCILTTVCCVCKKHKRNNAPSGANGLCAENPISNEIKLDDIDQKSHNDPHRSVTPESNSSFSQCTTDLLLDNVQRSDSSHSSKTHSTNNENQLVLESRPESTLSACTSVTTDGSERVLATGQTLNLSRPSTGDREVSIGATSASSSSQFPHKRLQEIGQESTIAIQCTSPRNSYYAAGAGSPSHAQCYNYNTVMLAQGSPENCIHTVVNLGQTESSTSDAVPTPSHPSPVEATPDNGPSYMSGPQHFLASGANPHPDDVWNTHQWREGRANEQDFIQLMESTQANGEPNNDLV